MGMISITLWSRNRSSGKRMRSFTRAGSVSFQLLLSTQPMCEYQKPRSRAE